MPVRISCAKCAKTLNLKDELAGKKIRCPGCKTIIQVPENASETTGATEAPVARKTAAPSSRSTAVRPTRVVGRSQAAADASADATVTMKSEVLCPSCGASIPKNEQSCPKCHYHLKLRRKIGLSQAISSANMHSQGLNLDGSKKVTRSDEAEERAEQGRKVGVGVMIALFSLLGLLAICIIWFFAARMGDYTVADLRARVPLPEMNMKDPQTFFPLLISLGNEKITVEAEADNITPETPKYPAEWPAGSNQALADFAQTLKAPYIVSEAVFSEGAAKSIIMRADELGGKYAPASIIKAPPAAPVYVWRFNNELNMAGSTKGAILDFGGDEYKLKTLQSVSEEYKRQLDIRNQKVKRATAREKSFGGKVDEAGIEAKFPLPAKQKLKITGKLSFIPFLDYDLNGGIGSYRFSAANGAPNIRRPDDVKPRDAKDLPRSNTAYFAPVILVEEIRVLPVGNN